MLLAQRGWNPVYGSRPLKRTIQRLVQDPLAMMLLEAKCSDGDIVEVGVQRSELTFSKTKAAATVA
jgi:ATP-dependent Clp protease ATP-binding subunit ClpA